MSTSKGSPIDIGHLMPLDECARQDEVEIQQARVGLFQNMAIKGVISEKTALTIIEGGTSSPVLTLPATK